MDGLNHSVIVGKCPSCLIYEERVAYLKATNAALAAAGQKLREELAEVGDHTDMIWDGALLREWDAALSDTGEGEYTFRCRDHGNFTVRFDATPTIPYYPCPASDEQPIDAGPHRFAGCRRKSPLVSPNTGMPSHHSGAYA